MDTSGTPPTPGSDNPWTPHTLRSALLDDPATAHLQERSLLRTPIADLTDGPPRPTQLADLTALLSLTQPQDGLDLTEREWVETALAVERCISHLEAVKLTVVAALDRRVQDTRPTVRLNRDSRRPTADALAPALKVAPGSASALVGLARQALDMPLALDALTDGLMTTGQFQVLASVLRRMPDPDARAQVEAVAVRKAATEVRARLAGVLEEAAVQADPGYTARAQAMGVTERDVHLAPSRVPGLRKVVLELERSDAARFWQVLHQIATRAKATPTLDVLTGQLSEEERTLPQLRADALVSLVVGMFTPTPTDDEGEGDPDRPADTRGPVPIPTPADRARLSELHVVVLADDLNDPDPGEPDDPDPGEPDDPDPGEPDDPDPGEPDDPDPGEPDGGGDSVRVPAPAPAPAPAGCRPARSLAAYRPMGWLPGYGRLDPDTTAAVIDAAPWRRMVADPTTGVLLQRSTWLIDAPPATPPAAPLSAGLGPTRRRRLALLYSLPAQPPPTPEGAYRPSSALAAFVRARDATCVAPACHHSTRTAGTQLDHTVAWGPHTPTRLRGGATAHGNLGCLCTRMHTAKTHGGWVLVQPTPGTFVWTTPHGIVYRRQATPLLPDLLGDIAA